MSLEENKVLVRRIHKEPWDQRMLEVAHELVAESFPNWVPAPGSPRDAAGSA